MANYESGRLRSYVHVPDDNAKMHVFGPSGEVPEWAARKITNPKAWATPPTFPDGAATVTDPGGGASDKDAVPPDGNAPPRPPTSGKGSGIEAWRAYADQIGARYDADDDRATVQAAVETREAELKATTVAEDGGKE